MGFLRLAGPEASLAGPAGASRDGCFTSAAGSQHHFVLTQPNHTGMTQSTWCISLVADCHLWQSTVGPCC